MAIDPNIALGVRPIEIANPLAQYGQIAQIQNYQNQNIAAQNQNALAQYQLGAAQRAETKDIARTNALSQAGTDDTAIANALLRSGDLKGYSDFLKSNREMKSAAALQKKHEVETEASQFKLTKDKLNHGYDSLGSSSTPQEAIQKLNDGVTKGYFDMKTATAEAQQLQNMTPEQFRQYRIEKVAGLLDAKDKLKSMLPDIRSQDTGGAITSIQNNPMMPGYGQPVQGMAPLAKTMTFADKTAQQRANIAAQQLALDRQSVVYQPNAEGGVTAFPAKLGAGEIPRGRTAVAAGPGMQPFQAKPSETEGKEIMSINQQKSTVQGALDAVKNTPDAFGWTTGNMPESVRSRLASSDENEARAFVFNVVSGVIKERAGTAQSVGEAATLARFLPAEGDNAKVIEDKLTGFQKYLNAKESGTTKKRSGPTNTNLAPMDQQALQWANSNPADPRAAAIKQLLGQ
jgi:hypothetical protein